MGIEKLTIQNGLCIPEFNLKWSLLILQFAMISKLG